MKVVITGASGYLGTLLIRELLRKGELTNRKGTLSPIDEIVLLDASFAAGAQSNAPPSSHPRLVTVAGSVADPELLSRVIRGDEVSVFHLAAVLTGVTERDLPTALQVNVDGTRHALTALAACGEGSRFVTTSSVTVYTRDAADSMVDDESVVRPASVYGLTKVISEGLVAAFRIPGAVDGRCGRLSTVVIRPKKIGVSAGASISDILRDVALGRPCDVLLTPQTRSAVIDYQSTVAGLVRLHEIDSTALGGNPIVNFPSLSAAVSEMEAAARAAAERRGIVPGQTRSTPNAFAQKTVDAWPSNVDASRAIALGITCKSSLAEICDAFLDDYASFWKQKLG